MVLAHNILEGARTRDIEISVDVTFDSMLLSDNTMDGLKTSGFYKPSPIQLHGIPLGKCGFDLFLEAKSGTGKTAVFTVIALEKIDLNKSLQSIILAPTREIAAQIADVIKQIGSKYVGLNVEVVMGGFPLEEDIAKFQKKVHILVGSPGRMRHLIQKKHIDISAVRLLVLDEADKLMDRSFKTDINYIFSNLPEQKQVIMSSATYPDTLKDILQNYVQKAQHICPDSTNILLGMKQFVTTAKSNMNIVVQTQNRFEELLNILSTIEFKQCLIFCNYQVRVGELCNMLIQKKWPADKLHGQLEQTQRLGALKTLKEYKCRILVSTDLAARGIDASNVNLVINFEPPCDWQTYLHRIGRAGRFGSYGLAISIVSEGKELDKFKEMIRTLSQSLKINYLSNGNELSNFIEMDESQEQTLEMEDINKTPQINNETNTPSVEDNHKVKNNINITKNISETPQVELSSETSVTIGNKCEAHKAIKNKLLNIKKRADLTDVIKHSILENNNVEDKRFAEVLFPNNTNNSSIKTPQVELSCETFDAVDNSKCKTLDMAESELLNVKKGVELSEIIKQQILEYSNMEDKTFAKVFFSNNFNNANIKEMSETVQVELNCETSDTVDSKCETLETEKSKVINIKKGTELSEIIKHQIHISSNVEDRIFAEIFFSNEAPEEVKVESFNDLLDSFKIHERESNDAIAIDVDSIKIVNEKSKTESDHTFLNSSDESCTKACISNEVPKEIKLKSFDDLLKSFKIYERESNDNIASQDITIKALNEENEVSEEIKLESFNDLMESFKIYKHKGNDAIANQDNTIKAVIKENEAPEAIKLESFDDLMKSLKIYEHEGNDAIANQNNTIKVVNEENEALEKIKLVSFNDLMESFKIYKREGNDAIASQDNTIKVVNEENEASEEIKLESFNDLLKSFKICKCESNDAIASQDDTIKTVNEKNEVPEGVQLESFNDLIKSLKIHKCEGNDAIANQDNTIKAVLEENETPEAIKPESFDDLMKSLKIYQHEVNAIASQNNTFKAVNEKIKTTVDHTVFHSSEASPTSNGDDGYNTNSCLQSRSTKSMQPHIKRKSDVYHSSNIKSNKGMETRSDINSKYNNWYKQFKTSMQQIEMSLYFEELSKM